MIHSGVKLTHHCVLWKHWSPQVASHLCYIYVIHSGLSIYLSVVLLLYVFIGTKMPNFVYCFARETKHFALRNFWMRYVLVSLQVGIEHNLQRACSMFKIYWKKRNACKKRRDPSKITGCRICHAQGTPAVRASPFDVEICHTDYKRRSDTNVSGNYILSESDWARRATFILVHRSILYIWTEEAAPPWNDEYASLISLQFAIKSHISLQKSTQQPNLASAKSTLLFVFLFSIIYVYIFFFFFSSARELITF